MRGVCCQITRVNKLTSLICPETVSPAPCQSRRVGLPSGLCNGWARPAEVTREFMSFVAVCLIKKTDPETPRFCSFYQIHHLALGDCMISWNMVESSSLRCQQNRKAKWKCQGKLSSNKPCLIKKRYLIYACCIVEAPHVCRETANTTVQQQQKTVERIGHTEADGCPAHHHLQSTCGTVAMTTDGVFLGGRHTDKEDNRGNQRGLRRTSRNCILHGSSPSLGCSCASRRSGVCAPAASGEWQEPPNFLQEYWHPNTERRKLRTVYPDSRVLELHFCVRVTWK